MTLQIVPVAGDRYAVLAPNHPVPVFTGSYEACTAFVERERLALCRS